MFDDYEQELKALAETKKEQNLMKEHIENLKCALEIKKKSIEKKEYEKIS